VSQSAAGRPSAFLLRHRAALAATAALGPAADVACGSGRHALALARAGLRVVAIDRSAPALSELAAAAAAQSARVAAVRADLETAAGLPLRPATCGAVVVTRYLHRPLCPSLAGLLVPGGLLLYETFTRDQAKLPYGPRNQAFLLAPGELPRLFPGLAVVDAEEGLFEDGKRWALARLLARRIR
jgi:tellurite methyltransferase